MRHTAIAERESVERKRTKMNKNWLGIIGAVLVVLVLVLLLGGGRISCHESFWDQDKQVIEIRND